MPASVAMCRAMEGGDPLPSHRDYPIADAVRAEAIKNYVPDGDYSSSQLTLKKGDIVWVLEQHSSGWWGGHKEGDDLTGWFPRVLVRPTGDEEGEGGPGDKSLERSGGSASQQGAELALYTCDHRAVASPQTGGAGRRRSAAQPGQDAALAGELQEMCRRLHAAEKAAAEAQAELELARRERERERLALDQERERERQAWEQERQHWDRRAREWELERHAHEEEVRRLHEALRRAGRRGRLGGAAVGGRGALELRGAAGDPGPAGRGEPPQPQHGRQRPVELRRGPRGLRGRVAAARPSRHDPARRRGHPARGSGDPPGVGRLGVGPRDADDRGGADDADPVRGLVAAAAGSLSARHNLGSGQQGVGQPPRPTPRAAATVPSWMATTRTGAATVGVPSSPRHRPRQLAAPGSAGGREDGPKIEVRALVSAFERRSNSQGAPQTHRAGDPSPGRALPCTAVAGSSVAAPVRALGSSSRAASREEHRREVDDEAATVVNFGMSPMQRQTHLHHVARQGMPASSSSPPSKAPVSVQDRIRRLNGGRLGR
eukprot:CAMPEP_0175535148 /NCGR_PEP_ID=MMETSP0096-20121207/24049_1 /TAXON_ID=311494 /ORGANISM="Alexandrium monilatum, Strain CCMP3105" /LENGTH=545 /DNA_ID=CAMNT_0016837935 /DNA_START=71 /DNA_END=1709 /DNA_ORIENTATION=+